MEKKNSGEAVLLRKKAAEKLEKERSERIGKLTASNGFCPSPADHLKIIESGETN